MSHPCLSSLLIGLTAAACGCTHTVKVEPIKVEPIHLTLDINVKVDRRLDEFFAYEQEIQEQLRSESPEVLPESPPPVDAPVPPPADP